jgi:hypothetical protein
MGLQPRGPRADFDEIGPFLGQIITRLRALENDSKFVLKDLIPEAWAEDGPLIDGQERSLDTQRQNLGRQFRELVRVLSSVHHVRGDSKKDAEYRTVGGFRDIEGRSE